MSSPGHRLGDWTTTELRALLDGQRVVALVPVGSVEPHGPHLPLRTDALIGEVACERAVAELAPHGLVALVAPTLAYGVTDFAAGFAGAIGITKELLSALVEAVAARLLADGFVHVCFVNNHLEPAHDDAVRGGAARFERAKVTVACPLTKRWGRTLSGEYKRGNCHAGEYETSLVLAGGGDVRSTYRTLPPIDTSLADAIRAGQTTFAEMGLTKAYTGAPAAASKEEGDAMYEKLAAMIVGEICEAIVPGA